MEFRWRENLVWKWIAHSPGIDVTLCMLDGKVIGAALGVHWADTNVYLTHATAVSPTVRDSGIGYKLRELGDRLIGVADVLLDATVLKLLAGVEDVEIRVTSTALRHDKSVGSRTAAIVVHGDGVEHLLDALVILVHVDLLERLGLALLALAHGVGVASLVRARQLVGIYVVAALIHVEAGLPDAVVIFIEEESIGTSLEVAQKLSEALRL